MQTMHTGVIRPRGVNIGNRRLIKAKIKGCQVKDWIVGETYHFHECHTLCDMCEWGLINV